MTPFIVLQLAGQALAADPFAEPLPEDHSRSVFLLALLLASFMVVGIAAVWAAVYFAMRWRRSTPEAKRDQRSLFDRLAAAHALSADDVQQLTAVAGDRSSTQAAMLLIDPRLLEAHAADDPAAAEWAVRLGGRLFGTAFVPPVKS
jgi:hypothetical protein